MSVSMLAPVNVCIHPRERWHCGGPGEYQSWLFHFVGKQNKARAGKESGSAQP